MENKWQWSQTEEDSPCQDEKTSDAERKEMKCRMDEANEEKLKAAEKSNMQSSRGRDEAAHVC